MKENRSVKTRRRQRDPEADYTCLLYEKPLIVDGRFEG
jgi:hypothetical protein